MLRLAEVGTAPGAELSLRSPRHAMLRFARDPSCRATVELEDGRHLSALAIQHRYLEAAEARLGQAFMPPWAEEVCRAWRRTLERLAHAPESVETSLDWAIKLALFRQRARRRGVAWESLPRWRTLMRGVPAALRRSLSRSGQAASGEGVRGDCDGLASQLGLRSELFEVDTRFGELGERGIFAALERAGALDPPLSDPGAIEHAVHHPPARGRAQLRGETIRQLHAARDGSYLCDWGSIEDVKRRRLLDLDDPFAERAEWRDLANAALEPCRIRELLRRCHDAPTAEAVLRRPGLDPRRELPFDDEGDQRELF